MKISKEREPGSTTTKAASLRGQRVSDATGSSAVEVVAGGGHGVDRRGIADSAERAVAALEQRRDAPTLPGTIVMQAVPADAAESALASSLVPSAPSAQTLAESPTQAEIAAAIAEGAATPFEELVPTDGMQTEAPALEAEAAGKAEAVAEAPELDVGRVKRRG